jgi:hypothetical protein
MGFRIYLAVLRQEIQERRAFCHKKAQKTQKLILVIFVPFCGCLKEFETDGRGDLLDDPRRSKPAGLSINCKTHHIVATLIRYQ